MFFCAELRNYINYNAFVVLSSEMLQIALLFLSPAQKWLERYKLQCFFCPELRNAINYIAFFVPGSEMIRNAINYNHFLCWTQKCYELQCCFCPELRNSIWCGVIRCDSIDLIYAECVPRAPPWKNDLRSGGGAMEHADVTAATSSLRARSA